MHACCVVYVVYVIGYASILYACRYAYVHACAHVWMYAFIHVRMDGWLPAWMDGQMSGSMHACACAFV